MIIRPCLQPLLFKGLCLIHNMEQYNHRWKLNSALPLKYPPSVRECDYQEWYYRERSEGRGAGTIHRSHQCELADLMSRAGEPVRIHVNSCQTFRLAISECDIIIQRRQSQNRSLLVSRQPLSTKIIHSCVTTTLRRKAFCSP